MFLNDRIKYFLFVFAAILTPSDEFQFWIERAHRGSKLCSKERASHFRDLFETIAKVYIFSFLYLMMYLSLIKDALVSYMNIY